MNKKQRILIESLTNANARITRLENENSLLHVRINTLEQFLEKYGERIARLEVIDKVCKYENEAEHNKAYPPKIDVTNFSVGKYDEALNGKGIC